MGAQGSLATEWFPGEVHSQPRQDWEPCHGNLVTCSQLLGMFFLLLKTVNNHELENVTVIAFNSDDSLCSIYCMLPSVLGCFWGFRDRSTVPWLSVILVQCNRCGEWTGMGVMEKIAAADIY